MPTNISTHIHNDEPFLHLCKLQATFARILNQNKSTFIASPGPTYPDYGAHYSYNYTDYYDMANTCFDMDCIWGRARKERIHILKPLTFILSLIGLIGIVGNIFVILVFSRTIQKRTSTYLVVMLAIIDLIACSIVIPGTLLKEWLFEFKIDLVCKLLEMMRTSVIISSAMILAAIAFDRFLLVYRRNTQDGNRHVTMAMILVTVLTGIGLGVPPMLGEGVYAEYDGGEVNIKVCLTNEQLISQSELNIYWQVVTSLFSLLIFIIIVMYMLIFIMVYRHSARIKGQDKTMSTNKRSSSERTKPSKLSAMLPFVGFSKSRNTVRPEQNAIKIQEVNKKPWAVTERIRKLFTNKVSPQNILQNVITIKVIGNSTTSNDSAIDSDSQPEPGPSQSANTPRSHDLHSNNIPHPLTNQNQLSPIPTNQRAAGSQSSSSSRRLQDLYLKNRSAHIKTTKVLCIITIVYIIAFLPMFLMTHDAITRNMLVFYLYFINNAANPIIYSFMNRKFRQDVSKVFACRRHTTTVWQG